MARYYYSKYTVKSSFPVSPNSWPWQQYSISDNWNNAYVFTNVRIVEPTPGYFLFESYGSTFQIDKTSPGTIGYVGSGMFSSASRVVKRSDGRIDHERIYMQDMDVSMIESAGTLVQSNILAENGTYPINGKHSDGYWYVRGSLVNNPPIINVSTTDNRTLYENDTFSVSGTATDVNSGNVVNVKYQLNSGTIRAITTSISSGAAIPFNKVLTFKQNKLFDGSTAVTDTLAEGTQHVLKVWAEDDQGGKSAEVVRVFYVIPNRPATLTINPFTIANELINTDKITISGSVSDPDANTVTVKYKVANGSYIEAYSGTGGNFSFQILLSALSVGANAITVQAIDSYGSVTSKTLNVNKSENKQSLLASVVRYKLTPPNVTAKGVVLWIQREVGDLIVGAEISMGESGATENFVPMTKSATAFVATGIEEDEFTFENATPVTDIIVKLTMARNSSASDKGIKLISGVLS